MEQANVSDPSNIGDAIRKHDESIQSDSGVFDESVQENMHIFAKSQFNINIKVIIKNTPHCAYNDVKAFLGTYSVKNIVRGVQLPTRL